MAFPLSRFDPYYSNPYNSFGLPETDSENDIDSAYVPRIDPFLHHDQEHSLSASEAGLLPPQFIPPGYLPPPMPGFINPYMHLAYGHFPMAGDMTHHMPLVYGHYLIPGVINPYMHHSYELTPAAPIAAPVAARVSAAVSPLTTAADMGWRDLPDERFFEIISRTLQVVFLPDTLKSKESFAKVLRDIMDEKQLSIYLATARTIYKLAHNAEFFKIIVPLYDNNIANYSDPTNRDFLDTTIEKLRLNPSCGKSHAPSSLVKIRTFVGDLIKFGRLAQKWPEKVPHTVRALEGFRAMLDHLKQQDEKTALAKDSLLELSAPLEFATPRKRYKIDTSAGGPIDFIKLLCATLKQQTNLTRKSFNVTALKNQIDSEEIEGVDLSFCQQKARYIHRFGHDCQYLQTFFPLKDLSFTGIKFSEKEQQIAQKILDNLMTIHHEKLSMSSLLRMRGALTDFIKFVELIHADPELVPKEIRELEGCQALLAWLKKTDSPTVAIPIAGEDAGSGEGAGSGSGAGSYFGANASV